MRGNIETITRARSLFCTYNFSGWMWFVTRYLLCCYQMGALATCQTNIACLLELVDAMQSGTIIDRVEEKIHQITGQL